MGGWRVEFFKTISWLWICKKKINWLNRDLKNNLASKVSKQNNLALPKELVK